MSKPTHLTPQQLAERLFVSEGTLYNWRRDGKGPNFLKLGRDQGVRGRNQKILYPIAEVEAFERENLKGGNSSAGAEEE